MSSKIFALALAVMVTMVGGAAAVSGTGPLATDDGDTTATSEADIDATYTNGTLTVLVTQGGEPVEDASVEMADGEFTTDANGTVSAGDVSLEDELEIEIEADGFEGEVSYHVSDGDLTIQEEEYEYDVGEADEEDHEEEAGDDEREDEADDDDESDEEGEEMDDEEMADDEDDEQDDD